MDGSAEYMDNISLTCDEDNSFLIDCKQEKQSKSESISDISNKSSVGHCDIFLSDIEALRESNDSDKEQYLMKKEIEKKRRILKIKRQELCDRLMSYKLMQFSATPDLTSVQAILNKRTSPETVIVPNQEEIKIIYENPPSTADCTKASLPGQAASMYNEHQILYNNLNEDSMMALAIQASLEDYEKSKGNSEQSPLPADGSSASGFSGSKYQTEYEKNNYPEALQNPSSDINIAGSSRSPKKPFAAVFPLRRSDTCQPETEAPKQNQEAGNDIEDIKPVQEDFMEGERYVGDKGKRPLSGKYSYKKRSKTTQVDSGQQPAGSDPRKTLLDSSPK